MNKKLFVLFVFLILGILFSSNLFIHLDFFKFYMIHNFYPESRWSANRVLILKHLVDKADIERIQCSDKKLKIINNSFLEDRYTFKQCVPLINNYFVLESVPYGVISPQRYFKKEQNINNSYRDILVIKISKNKIRILYSSSLIVA